MSTSNELTVESEVINTTLVVRPQGEIDLGRSPDLRKKMGEFIARKPEKLVVDLSGVSYMDSSGVATLVEALQQCRAGSIALTLCAMQDRVRSIFEIARLDMVFTITTTIEEAMEN
tara:strand:- start:54 stop:401 length:348 start_codon:yes stop_codon:yes gene_type:complete